MATPPESNPAYPGFGEEYTAEPAWIEAARLLEESFRFASSEEGLFAVLKTPLSPKTCKIHFSTAGELPAECGISPRQYVRRFAAMTKMLARAHPHPPGPCSGWCPDAVAHALTDKMNEAGFLKASGRFREQVDVEIGQASARGARWWSRRLVQLYEDAGLVRLDK